VSHSAQYVQPGFSTYSSHYSSVQPSQHPSPTSTLGAPHDANRFINLDVDLNQPGPSTYRVNQLYTDSHLSEASVDGFDESFGSGYLQEDDDDEEGEEEGEGSRGGVEEENMLELAQDQDEGGVEGGEAVEVDNEEPLYVNAKQYHRILKRRMARARLEELNRLVRSRKVSRASLSPQISEAQ
jgi:hypothetical protein